VIAADVCIARAAVAAEALTWLGTAYHHHARLKGVGVDCAQLLCAVYAACGLVEPVDTGFYPVDWHLHRSEERFMGWLARYARRCPTFPDGERLVPGDVYLFRYGRAFSHGSIAVNDAQVVHAYIGRGVMLNRLNEEPLDGRPVQRWSLFPDDGDALESAEA
jgi:NlpC/P60 family putative phage cell wall peptidase